jgi:hypothetical protein
MVLYGYARFIYPWPSSIVPNLKKLPALLRTDSVSTSVVYSFQRAFGERSAPNQRRVLAEHGAKMTRMLFIYGADET